MKKPLNVSAGQTLLSPGCRAALTRQVDAPIYYPEYFTAELETASLLQTLIGTQSDVLVITGNATHAMESTLISCLQPNEAMLAVNSGVFGQVFVELARAVGIEGIEVKVPYGKAIQPAELDLALERCPSVKAVSLVHIETSTGAMAPLRELARVVHGRGKLLIVDAVSSLGAVPLQMDEWGIDVLISSGQKALNAPQGLAILAVSQRAWQAYHDRSTPVPGVCLDLGIWRDYRRSSVEAMLAIWHGESSPPLPAPKIIHGPSPSGPLVYGLLGALKDLFQEGPEKVFRRHQVASRAVRAGLQALNLPVLTDETSAAPSVTAALLPEEIPEIKLRQELYEQYSIALGAGPVELGLNAFRVGTMGRTANKDFVLPVLSALGETLHRFGLHCQPEAGSRAARAVFAGASTPDLWEMKDEISNE